MSVRGFDSLVTSKEEADLLVEEFVQRGRRARERRVCGLWRRNTTILPRQHLTVIVSAPKGPGNLIGGAFLDVWVGLLNKWA